MRPATVPPEAATLHRARPAVWLALLLAAIVSGCAHVSRFERNALVAHGQPLEGSSEPLYFLIDVDLGADPDPQIMGALLQLSPDAAPLRLGELQPESVARYLPAFVPPEQWPETWKQQARQDDTRAGGGFHIRFRDNRLLSVGLCSHCAGGRQQPVVGTADGKHFYTLPLTRQQLIDVFGPPERVYPVSEVRY